MKVSQEKLNTLLLGRDVLMNYNTVQYLLSIGADPSFRNSHPIQWASHHGNYKIVKLLLKDKRCDPSANENFAIRFASGNGHHKVVELLLQDKRVDPRTNDDYCIHIAYQHGHDDIFKAIKSWYIENGIDPPKLED